MKTNEKFNFLVQKDKVRKRMFEDYIGYINQYKHRLLAGLSLN